MVWCVVRSVAISSDSSRDLWPNIVKLCFAQRPGRRLFVDFQLGSASRPFLCYLFLRFDFDFALWIRVSRLCPIKNALRIRKTNNKRFRIREDDIIRRVSGLIFWFEDRKGPHLPWGRRWFWNAVFKLYEKLGICIKLVGQIFGNIVEANKPRARCNP